MPPQHSVTAPILFIARTDPAWDLDTAIVEKDGLEGDEHDGHPLVAYFSGASRYDLDAPGTVITRDAQGGKVHAQKSARDYLKPDSRPRIWTLRRIKLSLQAELEDAPKHRGCVQAFALGVASLVNGPPGLEVKAVAGVSLSDQVVDAVADQLGAETVYDVGEAVLRASRAPTSAEKKL
jgi:hypothetical protein